MLATEGFVDRKRMGARCYRPRERLLALLVGFSGVLALLLSPCLPAQPSGEDHAIVLVVYSNDRLLPANVDIDRGLREGRPGRHAANPRFFSEFLGTPTFTGAAYEAVTAAYLRDKYGTQRPRVIVAAGYSALDFLLRHRDHMFPAVPIVHVGVDRTQLANRRLPADVLGLPIDYDALGTLRLALTLQPGTKRVVVVTGASPWGRAWETAARAAVASLSPPPQVEYLSALPTASVLARLADLGPGDIVFTPGYFLDGAGRAFTPRESVEAMVAAAGAPVYTVYASQIGAGIVGGRMTSYVDMGRATRAFADRLLAGEDPASVGAPRPLLHGPQVDWRQIRRWSIDPARLPADAVVHFRAPTFWETYRTQALIALIVIATQAGLIAALLLQRRARQRTAAALEDSEKRMRLAADAARLSVFEWHLGAGPERAAAGGSDVGEASRLPSEDVQSVLAKVHPADRGRLEQAVRQSALSSGREFDIEYRTLAADGRSHWFMARGHARADDPSRVTGVKMDISARKEAELQAGADRAALTHMARVSTLGQLSAAIAHQLNQPLTAILGNAETARRILRRAKPTEDSELIEILDDIISEDRRAADVIRRLADLYRRRDTDVDPVGLNDLVRETLALLHAELTMRQVSVAARLEGGDTRVLGSRIQLQQVLLNLVINAADAMSAIPQAEREVVVSTCIDAGAALVRVSVADRGTGIAEADLARVFDPFWTTKSNGIGVGLAVSHAIIMAHRGSLTAANGEHGGAVFCFALPMLAS